MGNLQEALHWTIRVPLFRNTLILKQLGLAIGIPFGLIALVIVLTSGKRIETLYALGLIAALLFFTWLFLMLVYRGVYEAEFLLNESAALCRTQAKQLRKNRIVNGLTVFLGLLSGKPTAAAAGMLAQSRQEVLIQWGRVSRVRYLPRKRTVLLRGGWAENLALFCDDENYHQVAAFVQRMTAHSAEGGDR